MEDPKKKTSKSEVHWKGVQKLFKSLQLIRDEGRKASD